MNCNLAIQTCEAHFYFVIKLVGRKCTLIWLYHGIDIWDILKYFCHRASWGSAVRCKTRDCIEIITMTAVFLRLATWGIYCTDFLSQMTSQVKSPMQFMAYDNTEHFCNTGETAIEQHFQRRCASTELQWIWMTGINYSNLEMHRVGMT